MKRYINIIPAYCTILVPLLYVNITHSSHSIAQKIQSQTIIQYTLDPEISQHINDELANISIDPYTNWPFYQTFAKEILEQYLPEELVMVIRNMNTLNNPVVLVVHNFPCDIYLPETPRDGHRPFSKFDDLEHGKGFVSEICLLGLCSLLNAHPDYDENEKDGTYIHQIIPRDDPQSTSEVSSYGSAMPFGPHTENVYQEQPLKFFALLGLRGDVRVNTGVILLDTILDYLQHHVPPGKTYEWFIEQMKKDYLQKTGPTFGAHQFSIQAPILTITPSGHRIFKFNTTNNRTVGCDADTYFVSEFLKNMLLSPEFKEHCFTMFNLQKGTLLLFNNWEVMHSRDSFTIDPQNWRWLQRCYFALNT